MIALIWKIIIATGKWTKALVLRVDCVPFCQKIKWNKFSNKKKEKNGCPCTIPVTCWVYYILYCYTALGEGLSKRRDTYYFCSCKKYSFCSSFTLLLSLLVMLNNPSNKYSIWLNCLSGACICEVSFVVSYSPYFPSIHWWVCHHMCEWDYGHVSPQIRI